MGERRHKQPMSTDNIWSTSLSTWNRDGPVHCDSVWNYWPVSNKVAIHITKFSFIWNMENISSLLIPHNPWVNGNRLTTPLSPPCHCVPQTTANVAANGQWVRHIVSGNFIFCWIILFVDCCVLLKKKTYHDFFKWELRKKSFCLFTECLLRAHSPHSDFRLPVPVDYHISNLERGDILSWLNDEIKIVTIQTLITYTVSNLLVILSTIVLQ